MKKITRITLILTATTLLANIAHADSNCMVAYHTRTGQDSYKTVIRQLNKKNFDVIGMNNKPYPETPGAQYVLSFTHVVEPANDYFHAMFPKKLGRTLNFEKITPEGTVKITAQYKTYKQDDRPDNKLIKDFIKNLDECPE